MSNNMETTSTTSTTAQARKSVSDSSPYTREKRLEHVRSGFKDASFAYGRIKGVLQVMRRRCSGECLTDDAEMIAELVTPFIVEAAIHHRHHEPYSDAQSWFRQHMPILLARQGAEHVRHLVTSALEQREAAEPGATGRFSRVRWLPTMDDLVQALRPTRAEIAGLRGWGCIDPLGVVEKKEADKLRKRAERITKGATPRAQSQAATRPWDAEGISESTWRRRKRKAVAGASDRVSSAPYSSTVYGTDETLSSPNPIVAANDDLPATAAA